MKKPSDHLGVKIVGGLKEAATPWAGVSLLVDLYRRLEMGEAADRVAAREEDDCSTSTVAAVRTWRMISG